MQCILCGREEETELVSHINTAHPKWNVQKYLMFFPFSRVVNQERYALLENYIHFGMEDEGIKDIPEADRHIIVSANENQRPVRSEITVEDYE